MTTTTQPLAVARRRTKRGGRALPMVVTLTAVLGLGWFGWTKTHPAADPLGNILTAKVSRGDLVETVTATGSVTSQTGAQVKIGSQITGVIKRLYADVGSKVKAGQIIAELDLPDIRAQLVQAEDNLAAAQQRLLQQQTGMGMQTTQTTSLVSQAKANLRAAQAKLNSIQAAANQQYVQTPNDVKRAQTAIGVANAALSTAKSNLTQVQAGVSLQIANAQEAINQAKANAANSAANLKRQQTLEDKGFVAASVVDAAQAQDAVYNSQVAAAQQNLQLVRQKNTADLQSAENLVTQAEQNVASAQAALASARAETYTDASRKADVLNQVAAVKQSQAALQAVMGNVPQDVIKHQQIQEAQDAVRAARAQVDYNRAQLNKTFIRSPISGTVLQLASQQGETLAAGLSAPTLIIVADLNRLQVDALVDETDIGKVRLGQPAEIRVDAFPKRVFTGHLTKVASGSTIQQGVVTYDVTIGIEDKRHQLKPDMTASVTIQTGKRTNVILVPAEAVKLGTRGSTVNVLTKKDGKSAMQSVKVKTGGSDGVNTEIRDGLKEGDTIVLAGGDSGKTPGRGPTSPFGPRGGGGGGGGGGKGGGGGGGGKGGG